MITKLETDKLYSWQTVSSIQHQTWLMEGQTQKQAHLTVLTKGFWKTPPQHCQPEPTSAAGYNSIMQAFIGIANCSHKLGEGEEFLARFFELRIHQVRQSLWSIMPSHGIYVSNMIFNNGGRKSSTNPEHRPISMDIQSTILKGTMTQMNKTLSKQSVGRE